MVNSGTEIFNPRTGQRTIFLQTAADTGGELCERKLSIRHMGLLNRNTYTPSNTVAAKS
ncbi:MAG: hypothetical protein R3E39_16055 [Anaerolineae bacterium]